MSKPPIDPAPLPVPLPPPTGIPPDQKPVVKTVEVLPQGIHTGVQVIDNIQAPLSGGTLKVALNRSLWLDPVVTANVQIEVRDIQQRLLYSVGFAAAGGLVNGLDGTIAKESSIVDVFPANSILRMIITITGALNTVGNVTFYE